MTMFMKKTIFLFATVILLTSCGAFDRVFIFRFYNHSSCDVSLILDLNPYDGIITPGSSTDFVLALDWKYIENDKRWDKLVKDSMHIYVLDAEVMKLRPGDILSKEVIDKIDPDMILTRMTVTHNDLAKAYARVDYWP